MVNRKGLGTGEEVVLRLRTHAKRLAGPILFLLLDAVVLGVGLGLIYRYAAESARTILAIVLAVVVVVVLIALVVIPWLRWLNTTYTFTNRRIITETGILNRSGHDLPLNRINDVAYDKSLSDRMFGCGTLRLTTAAEDPVILDDIPNIEQVHVQMTDLLFGNHAQQQDVAGSGYEQGYQQPYGGPEHTQPYGH